MKNAEKSELVRFAEDELNRLIKNKDDEIQKEMNGSILKIIETFSEQNHSGFSASYAITALNRLLHYKPIEPLTGLPDEWNEVGTGVYQNKRCSSVFVNDGVAEDIDAIAVSDDGGLSWHHSKDFRYKIEFPYYPPVEPEKVYIEYKDDSETEYEVITDNLLRIQALFQKSIEFHKSIDNIK